MVDAASQGGGFTPGFASVLTCADGSRHFVKAASTKAQKLFAGSYREEARKLQALPPGVPAPRLLWLLDDDWVVLGIEYVEARTPRRPWRQAELDTSLDGLELVARALTPSPPELGLVAIADEMASWPEFWNHVAATRAGLPRASRTLPPRPPGSQTGSAATPSCTPTSRDDNTLIRPDGTAVFCDWNWPTVGAAWLDTLFMLIGPRGDGLDVDAVLAARPLTREVDADHVDRVLALLVGYFFKSGDEPVPATSPYLRDHQLWQGEVVWQWLCERRGW